MPAPDAFRALAAQVNNWGRWGDDDEIGTINLVTPDVVQRAAACVRTGKTFSLAIPLSEDGPQIGFVKGRVNPTRTMIMINEPAFGDPTMFCSSDDVVTMGLQAATHWDSLVHVTYDGRLYNGNPPATITEAGASRCGIDKIATLVSRGVLLDVARVKGVDRLEPGYSITGDDLDAAEAQAQRHGHERRHRARPHRPDPAAARRRQDRLRLSEPGPVDPHRRVVPRARRRRRRHRHLRVRGVPRRRPRTFLLPVHLLHLVEMGLTQGQNFDLEALAADCAADGIYEFLLEASPQPFVGGLGSPVNPVAVK